MKKSLLALAVSAAAFTGAASAAEIYSNDNGSIDFYGQLRTEMLFKDADDYSADLSAGSSRTGVNASYTVTEGFDILGSVELGINPEDDDVNVRTHLFGFGSDYGTLTFGKSLISSDDVGGTDYSYFFGGTGNLYGTLNGGWNDSRIKYQLNTGNWWVNATYGLNDDDGSRPDYNGDLAEAFVGATYGDLSFHAGGGYNRVHDTKAGMDISNKYYEATLIYNILNNLQVSGTYYGSQLENEGGSGKIDSNSISVGAYWTFIEKTSLYAGYEYTKADASDMTSFNDPDDSGELNNAFVGVEYMFSSWARVFAEAGYKDGESVGYADTDNNMATGPQSIDSETNFGIGARFYW
ncbi:porin [Vibrio litoralis]|uniref:porin n=1 Tax=Vibrio litoralis TaxID=335972 RepID=UPI001866FEF1|nr:porin [Vibrio litoralis]